MPTLVYLEQSYDCTTAIKGDDYIRLLDDSGCLVASFDGISDFSAFTLRNGSYTSPTPDHDCYVAVIRDDGTFGKGGHRCSEIVPKSVAVTLMAAGWVDNTQTVDVVGVLADETAQIITPTPALTSQTAYYEAGVKATAQAENSLTFTCDTPPEADLTVHIILQGVSA